MGLSCPDTLAAARDGPFEVDDRSRTKGGAVQTPVLVGVSMDQLRSLNDLLTELRIVPSSVEANKVAAFEDGQRHHRHVEWALVELPGRVDAATLAHALPTDQRLVHWHDLSSIAFVEPEQRRRDGRRVVWIAGQMVFAACWRTAMVFEGIADLRPRGGVLFADRHAGMRWFPPGDEIPVTNDELWRKYPDQVAHLWAHAVTGWPRQADQDARSVG